MRSGRAVCLPLMLFSAILPLFPGCGYIADKDRIVVAELDGRKITRGELYQIIREMPDNERPEIRNKGDMLRVLNTYIDEQIRIPLGKELDQKLPEEQRQVLRAQAREEVFTRNEDYNFRAIHAMEVPADGSATPAMQDLNITARGMQNMKDLIENNTDIVYEKLLGSLAVQARAALALQQGQMRISEDLLKQEYELRKGEFMAFEWIKFRAIRFMATPEGIAESAVVRQRIEKGETFDALFTEYAAKDVRYVIESEIENNPALEKFRGFWDNASGAETGQVIGPVYLPSYTQSMEQSGKVTNVQMPDTYLVLQVLEHRPARPMTIEEARPQLLMPLATAQMTEQLRTEHGVQIYEDMLPDVGSFNG